MSLTGIKFCQILRYCLVGGSLILAFKPGMHHPCFVLIQKLNRQVLP